MKRLSILIADDSPEVCSLLEIWLCDHHAVSVHSGREALAALALLYFDVVLTDVHLPDLSGIEIIRRVKSAQPSVHVIAITGGSRTSTSNDSIAAAIEAGADAAIPKPFKVSRVLSALALCMGTETTDAVVGAQVGSDTFQNLSPLIIPSR